MTLKSTILTSARADSIPEGESGLWFIRKTDVDRQTSFTRHGKPVSIPTGTYTHLFRMTTATMHRNPPGECVMEDTPPELETHLAFVLRAHGRVLVTGLGLGCVVRGLLVNPAVEYVTCIERSKDVLKLVLPYMPIERLTVIHADALEWAKANNQKFDCAWHDLWADRENGEPHLQHWHVQLIYHCRKRVTMQGAWALPRSVRRVLRQNRVVVV